MKNILPALLLFSASFFSSAVAQDATPTPTPKFTGGTITGDAASGGPVGNVSSAEVRDSGYNSGGDSGGSTGVDTKATPTPSATPRNTPKPSVTPKP